MVSVFIYCFASVELLTNNIPVIFKYKYLEFTCSLLKYNKTWYVVRKIYIKDKY